MKSVSFNKPRAILVALFNILTFNRQNRNTKKYDCGSHSDRLVNNLSPIDTIK